MKRIFLGLSSAFLSLFLSALAAYAAGEGRVIGTVTAADGTPVAGTAIKVTRPEVPNFSQDKTTDAKGEFSLLLLDASVKYKIHIEKPGFKPIDDDLVPKINDTIRVSYSLAVITVEDEIATPEVEPATRLFQINLRFAKAQLKEEVGYRRFAWSYPEISLTLSAEDHSDILTGKDPAGELQGAVTIRTGDIESQGAKIAKTRDVTAGTVAGKELSFPNGAVTTPAFLCTKARSIRSSAKPENPARTNLSSVCSILLSFVGK